jgi:hypothetical protein
MSAKISNTGQLREFLANMMMGVKDGDVKVDEAARIVKLAEKINESFYAELKVSQINLQLERQVAELGKLELGNVK